MLQNSDYTFTLSVSTGNYACKPCNGEISKITFAPTQLTVETALQCANQGKAFCYTFNLNKDGILPIAKKTKQNFVSTSTIIYDFDDMEVNMTDYISQIPYKPSFAYPTYSDGKNGLSRFRLAYVFDNDIQGEENFDEIYHAIANANQFIKETKEHGGWDVRNVSQMYYGTTPTANTYRSDYIYNVSDFAGFITPIIAKAESKTCQSVNVNSSRYKDIDKTFLNDLNTLSHAKFFAKYYDAYHHIYEASLETMLILSENEMWYEFPENFFSVVKMRRGNGKYTVKFRIGDDRKTKLYITAQIMVHNAPDISLENLIYNLAIERDCYYENYDNKINNQVLIQTAINAFNKRINLSSSKHGGYAVNKDFWFEQGISTKQAVGYIKGERNVQRILPYIDSTKTVKQNHEILCQNGIKISLKTLYRMVSRGVISMVMSKTADSLHLMCQNDDTNRILELIKINKYITNQEIAAILSMGIATVKRRIKKMKGKYINRIGDNRTGYWECLDSCQNVVEPQQEYLSTCTMSEYEWLTYNFESDITPIEQRQPMTYDELRVDMFNDGWTEQEILDFFSIYAVA